MTVTFKAPSEGLRELNQAELMKKLEEVSENQLVTQEAIATIYEENAERDIKNSEVLATIYEELLEGKE